MVPADKTTQSRSKQLSATCDMSNLTVMGRNSYAHVYDGQKVLIGELIKNGSATM